MNQISFSLFLGEKEIKIPTRFSRLADVSTDIYNELIFSSRHQYRIKSDVSEEVLRLFIRFWVEGQVPDISIENISEFYYLSEEFNLLKEQVQQANDSFNSNMLYLGGLLANINSNSSFYEEKISILLDNYLKFHGKEMMKLPIQKLYNIFSHQKRVLTDHDLAYSLILNEYQRIKKPDILILLKKLDGTKLSQKNLFDCISNRNERLGLMPYIKRKKDTIEKFRILKEIVDDQQAKISKYEAESSRINENDIADIKKTIKINSNQMNQIESKHKESISKIENDQAGEITKLKRTLQEREEQINNQKSNHSNDIKEIKDKLNDNDKRIRKRDESGMQLPNRVQVQRRFKKREHQKQNPGKTIDLFYDSTENGRFNGIIHYLTDECNGNVHDQGAVEVTSSSVIPMLPILPGLPIFDDESHLPINAVDLDNESNCFISDINPNSWICYDFVDAKVKPNAYSIRSYMDGISHLMNWQVEGSNDQIKWNILDKRTNEHSLDECGISNTFFIEEEKVQNFYRYIRLKQIGKNTKDNDSLCISAFEIFGSFYE